MPDLDILLYYLEAANSHPAEANDRLKQLNNDVEKVIKNIDIIEQYFVIGKDD